MSRSASLYFATSSVPRNSNADSFGMDWSAMLGYSFGRDPGRGLSWWADPGPGASFQPSRAVLFGDTDRGWPAVSRVASESPSDEARVFRCCCTSLALGWPTWGCVWMGL